MKSKPTTVRLTEHGKCLLSKMADRLGISRSDVIEIAIREKAESMGVIVDEDNEKS